MLTLFLVLSQTSKKYIVEYVLHICGKCMCVTFDSNNNNNNNNNNHQSPITNHQSPITNHQSPITNHQSPITNHQSPITNHQSPITITITITIHTSGLKKIVDFRIPDPSLFAKQKNDRNFEGVFGGAWCIYGAMVDLDTMQDGKGGNPWRWQAEAEMGVSTVLVSKAC